jgi:hypothetical protein
MLEKAECKRMFQIADRRMLIAEVGNKITFDEGAHQGYKEALTLGGASTCPGKA